MSVMQFLKTLIKISFRRPLFVPPGSFGLNNADTDLINQVYKRNLTYLSPSKLAKLLHTCAYIEESRLPGIFIEAGCALGGSTILIASKKSDQRKMYVYDVFGMIPPPSENDTSEVHDRYQVIVSGKSKGINGDKYYGYRDDLYEAVRRNLSMLGIDIERQSISLIKGMIQDTMILNGPIAFAHIDVDWYEPVMISLQRIWPLLVSGGSIILDDYYDWGGCRKAVDEFLGLVVDQYILDEKSSSLKITKV